MGAWKTDSFSGLKVPAQPHLVDCDTCEGAGTLVAGFHANDPNADEVDCEDCAGSGQRRCDNDGCCDFDPPEDD